MRFSSESTTTESACSSERSSDQRCNVTAAARSSTVENEVSPAGAMLSAYSRMMAILSCVMSAFSRIGSTSAGVFLRTRSSKPSIDILRLSKRTPVETL